MRSTLLGIDHVALRALDLAATERFYGEILGLPVVDKAEGVSPEWDDHPWRHAHLCPAERGACSTSSRSTARRGPSAVPALARDRRARRPRACRSRADLETWRKRLEEHGFPILEEQDHGGGPALDLRARPNGHYLELTCRG